MRSPCFSFLDAGNIWPEGGMVDSVVTVASSCASSSKCRKADVSSLYRGKKGVEESSRLVELRTEDSERPLLLFKEVSAILQCRADKTDILEDLYISSLSDSYVGQETHLHFTLASLASLHVL